VITCVSNTLQERVGAMIVLKRVLVPTDFSKASTAAVTYGVALARAFHAQLFLLHVLSSQDFDLAVERERVLEELLADSPPSAPPGLDEVARHAVREQFGKTLSPQEEAEVGAEYVLRTGGTGGPYLEIVHYAQENDIDLIVMGAHGHSFVAHILTMGSVAEKVVRRAPCPVLTVRHPEHEFVLPEPGQ
jgi:nucleotide-binding universal stress UspA family protein